MDIGAFVQGGQKLLQAGGRVEYAVRRVVRKIASFCADLRCSLGDNLRYVIDYVSPPVGEADDAASRWIAAGAMAAVRAVGTEDPVESYCWMTPQERLEILREIARNNAGALGIAPCELRISDELPANNAGYYHHRTRSITLNSRLLTAQPMTPETAKTAISTVIHEMFHAYQYVVMYEPRKYGIPEDVAQLWRINRKNYCTFEQNPILYLLQPMEEYARFVEEGAMQLLRDTEAVERMLDSVNADDKEEI